ncbi:MAG: hypothetical protein KatS3mg110_1864 [Pirellulaceae bacterium]|nr:MAG: hypothetical protein KatS3mg110_1864 [Pirellulaceae bacterium]
MTITENGDVTVRGRFGLCRLVIWMNRAHLLRWYLAAFAVLMPIACRTMHTAGPPEATLLARQQLLFALDAAQRSDWPTAEQALRTAQDLAPHDERIAYQLSRVLWQQGRRHEAMQLMEQAISWSGQNGDWLVELGRMYLAEGNHAAAEEAARKALLSASSQAAAHALLGDVYHHRGNLEEALRHYHRSMDLAPPTVDVLLATADIYRVWGEPWRVMSTLQKLDPGRLSGPQLAYFWYLQGAAHQELGHTADALACWQRAVTIRPTEWNWRVELARALWQAGYAIDARQQLQLVLQAVPDHPEAARLSQEIAAGALADHIPVASEPSYDGSPGPKR